MCCASSLNPSDRGSLAGPVPGAQLLPQTIGRLCSYCSRPSWRLSAWRPIGTGRALQDAAQDQPSYLAALSDAAAHCRARSHSRTGQKLRLEEYEEAFEELRNAITVLSAKLAGREPQ